MSTLRSQAAASARWTGSSSVATTALYLIQLGVLARLLEPQDFGLMAMLMVVTGLARTVADAGISKAIIHRQNITAGQLSSLYWLTVLIGAAMFTIVILSAPLAVAFFDEPRLPPLLACSALTFLVTPWGQQFQLVLEKELRFKELALIESGSALSGTLLAIVLAFLGYGIWALVWGHVGTMTARAACLSALGWAEWPPKWRLRSHDIRSFLGFGFYQMGERLINFCYQSVDKVVIGSIVGAQTLGYYALAYNLVIQPIARINPALSRVAFPVFARVQSDPNRMRSGFFLIRRFLATVNAPLIFGLAAIAPVLIPGAFGAKWTPTVILVQILSGAAFLRSITNPIGSVLMAKGRADIGFMWNLCIFALQIPGVYVGLRLYGVTGAALAVLLLQIVAVVIGYPVLTRSMLGRCGREYLVGIIPSLAMASVMVAVVASIPIFLSREWYIVCAAQVISGGLLYLGLFWIFQRHAAIDFIRMIK